MRNLATLTALVLIFSGASLAGCQDSHPTATTATHAAPLGLDCAPVDGALGACTIAVQGAPGCDILHADRRTDTFECDTDAGWRRIGRTDNGKHGICFLNAGLDLVACGDGYRAGATS